MDLEIGLHVSACACQAQIFPRGKRQVVPHFLPLNSFHSVEENSLLVSPPSMGLPSLFVFNNLQICQTGTEMGGY